jgi:uncharacterized protein (TIGR00730 family)
VTERPKIVIKAACSSRSWISIISTPPASDPAASATYRLAALDQDFLLGDSLRGVRFHLEYEKPEQILRAAGIESTIVVFGSARSREDSLGDGAVWYQAARDFGRLASERGGACLGQAPLRNVIATGGGPGIMEAANRGAREAGAPTIGYNIALPHEQVPNPYITPSLTFQFHYFAMRKMHFAMRAAALVVFPGGFGTFDELFEILTLRQTRKMPRIPVVLYDEVFWREAVGFDALARRGLIAREDLDLFGFAETPEQIWTCLVVQGLN